MAEEQKIFRTVTIHNKISSNYRSHHVDGAYGGLTPRGLISISFFSERFPIPKSQEMAVETDGRLNKVISNSPDSKTGIIREYETSIFIDLNVAKEVVDLLNLKITELENLMSVQRKVQKK
jgi:hypothetical protein